jgi:periplasmic protein TonB
MPSFPNGINALYKYLNDKLRYPSVARENGIDGTVTLRFVVTETGKIEKIEVVRGIGGGCDEEAIRVVKSMPDWSPGKHQGKAVPVRFTLPIKFTLKN